MEQGEIHIKDGGIQRVEGQCRRVGHLTEGSQERTF